jgi:hypothetical protein
MNPHVQAVTPNPDYTLMLTFTNGEVRVFDVKTYLQTGIFQELQDLALFRIVTPCSGSIQWQHRQDFCPDTLYLDSTPISESSSQSKCLITAIAWVFPVPYEPCI